NAESFQPQVQIANRGSNTLTSLQINFQVDGQDPAVYFFNGNLETNQTDVVTLPLYFTGEGDHVYTAWCAIPNNMNDEYVFNDSTSGSFTVVSTIPKNTLKVYVTQESPT